MELNGAEEFRCALQVLVQRTRFQIFRLISAYPGNLSLEDICSRLGGDRVKFYHHLYQMVRVKLIVVDHYADGKKCFSPNWKFLYQGQQFFSNCGIDQH